MRGMLPSAQRLERAIDDAVVYRVNGSYRTRGNGLSAYYSYDGDEDSYWSFAESAPAPLAQKCLYYYLLYGEMPDEAQEILANAKTAAPPAKPAAKKNLFRRRRRDRDERR